MQSRGLSMEVNHHALPTLKKNKDGEMGRFGPPRGGGGRTQHMKEVGMLVATLGIISRATLYETFRAKYDGVSPRTP